MKNCRELEFTPICMKIPSKIASRTQHFEKKFLENLRPKYTFLDDATKQSLTFFYRYLYKYYLPFLFLKPDNT
jgi:hypothetical protein